MSLAETMMNLAPFQWTFQVQEALEVYLPERVEDWPLANIEGVAVMSVAYVALLFLGQHLMSNQKGMELTFAAFAHNAILCVLSLWMFLGLLYNTVANWEKASGGIELVVCDKNQEVGVPNMNFWYYIFYLSKFYEFVDTAFLVLRKRPVIFLHWYHHAITAYICLFAWFYPFSSNWYGPLVNTFVHVWMYAYYALSLYIQPLRKYGKYVTYIQLAQFIGGIIIMAFVGLNCTECNGSLFGWGFAYVQYLIFLGLFLQMHNNRTKRIAKKLGNKPSPSSEKAKAA
eukprot:Clim_evm10s148 gene=Clim_evmTU10s148